MPRRDRTERGFTLIEILVALLVTAFLLAVISTALGTARARDLAGRDEARALLIGEEYLARRAEGKFAPGEETVERGRYAIWIREHPVEEDPRRLLVLSEIEVRVTADGDRPLYAAQLRRLKVMSDR